METLKTVIPGDIKSLIKAKHDRVVIIRDAAPTEIDGIAVTELAQATTFRKNTGTILTFGARCGKQVKENQRVMFGRSAGTEITINEQKLVIMHEQDLMLDLDTLQPFHNKILLKPGEMIEKIKSIFIPENIQEQPLCATVVRVGPDCVETVAGEKVLMGKFAGLQIDLGDEDYHLILREDDLFASV